MGGLRRQARDGQKLFLLSQSRKPRHPHWILFPKGLRQLGLNAQRRESVNARVVFVAGSSPIHARVPRGRASFGGATHVADRRKQEQGLNIAGLRSPQKRRATQPVDRQRITNRHQQANQRRAASVGGLNQGCGLGFAATIFLRVEKELAAGQGPRLRGGQKGGLALVVFQGIRGARLQ